MPYKYIGRTTDYKGKTLWEIVGNLKNYGIGRIVARSRMERYPEPSYFKILSVETCPNPVAPSMDDVRLVKVMAEQTFRGRKISQPVDISNVSYKTDYRLIPKEEENDYCKYIEVKKQERIFPRTMSFPPLMREMIIREMKENNEEVVQEPQLEIVYKIGQYTTFRIAKEGETPTVEFAPGLGTPVSHSLYKGLKL